MRRLTEHLNRALSSLCDLWTHEKGATATEYSVLVGFVAVVIVAGVGLFGTSLNGVYTGMTTTLKTALGIP